jgi:transposase
MENTIKITERYHRIKDVYNERDRRLFLANEAVSYGYGGQAVVSRATGVAKNTIRDGILQLEQSLPAGRIRDFGGGRKPSVTENAEIINALREIVEPTAMGDPMKSTQWVNLSLRSLEAALNAKGFKISYNSVKTILKRIGYSLQVNRKTSDGLEDHPDRDEQFKHIANEANASIADGQPVISVDAKKKN